ncbi:MAG: hypothetical protein AAGE96_17985 [Cyanobacteria bacterium P01_G01_bin.19]
MLKSSEIKLLRGSLIESSLGTSAGRSPTAGMPESGRVSNLEKLLSILKLVRGLKSKETEGATIIRSESTKSLKLPELS